MLSGRANKANKTDMEKLEIENERYPHEVRITRTIPGRGTDGNPYAEEDAPLVDASDVLYDGIGRVYTDTTTTGDENVDENKRKASIPVRYDEWNAYEKPLDGDRITVRIGESAEEGIVDDCEADNNRTVIYWRLKRV